MNSERRFPLDAAFKNKQDELLAALRMGQLVNHPTTKGDDAELNWVAMLDGLLPHRYGVTKAHVIDSLGNESLQIDVVIHDQFYSPLLFDIGGTKYVPAESVYAVFEVKQELTRSYMFEASDKVASVRDLHRTSDFIPNQFDIEIKKDLRTFTALGGVLVNRSRWTPPFGDPFTDAITENPGSRAIDIGCALEAGAFDIDWTGSAPTIETSAPERSLIHFAMRLLRRLQLLGTVPAIDYSAYENAI
jgi:hypothetical protein